MKRREFIAGLGAAVAWPVVARAQSVMPVVGYVHPSSAAADFYRLAPFRKELSDAGFVEGRNVAIEFRYGDGDSGRLPTLISELVNRRVTVLYAGTNASALAAKAVTPTIPIVFTTGADPVKSGLVASLNRPGGNATGISFFSTELEAKRLGLLHELVPRAELVGVLADPTNPAYENQTRDLQQAAHTLGVKIHIERASNDREVEAAFATFAQQRIAALLIAADPYFNINRALIVAAAAKYRIPTIYEWREFADAGGLISYGTNLVDSTRQAANYVGRILKGANPADLPVLQPTKFELVINLKTANKLGFEVPAGLSARADEVIE